MKIFFQLLTTLALSLAAHAAQVSFLAWDEGVAQRPIAAVDGTRQIDIESLHPLQRTHRLNLTPGENGIVLRTLDKKLPDGNVASLNVSINGLNKPLIILIPDPKAPSGLRGHAIEDTEDNFSWGSFRFLNATGKPLAVALGKEKKLLPASWNPIDIKPSGNVPSPAIIVAQANPKTALYSSVWNVDPDLRRLVIILNGTDVRTGPLSLKIIPENRNAPTPVAGGRARNNPAPNP